MRLSAIPVLAAPQLDLAGELSGVGGTGRTFVAVYPKRRDCSRRRTSDPS